MTTFVRRDFADGAALAPAFAQWTAERLAAAIAARGAALLVVSGGRTPLLYFRALSDQPIDWSRVAVTLADERRVADDSPRSNAKLVRETLLQGRAGAAPFVPLADARLDEGQELAAANARIVNLPLPADVVALGMGDDGRIFVEVRLEIGAPGIDGGDVVLQLLQERRAHEIALALGADNLVFHRVPVRGPRRQIDAQHGRYELHPARNHQFHFARHYASARCH